MATAMVTAMEAIKNRRFKAFRLFCLILMFSPLWLMAQQRRVSAFIFQPEWYAGIHTGVNLIVAEGYPDYNLFKSSGITARPLIGYQFSPSLGVRGMLGVQTHRWNDIRSGNNDSILSFGSQTLQADLMLNVSNILFGYSLNAPLDISLFAGAGALHRNTILPDKGYFSYLVRGGLQFDYRINQSLELNMLAEINVTDDKFNAFVTGTPVDLYPTVMVGLTWHFRTNKPFSRRCCD